MPYLTTCDRGWDCAAWDDPPCRPTTADPAACELPDAKRETTDRKCGMSEIDELAEALRIVRQVESDMAEQAMKAWRSADARRGLSDHEALILHADALTRWSERLRMALDGENYRDEEPA